MSDNETQKVSTLSWADADWFLANKDSLPKEPFRINCGVFVSNAPKYFDYLVTEISLGTSNPRYLTGAIQADLAKVRELFSKENKCSF